MESKCLELLLLVAVGCVSGDFVEPRTAVTSLRSLAEGETRLPCRYLPEAGQKVVQVTWSKELNNGEKEQIITAHFTDGHTEFGRYSGRVKFESRSPTENSALLIPRTEISDEGTFRCHISTFPNGNFDRYFKLTVWVVPISSLDASPLAEGSAYGVAASCRAVGRPPPLLRWDTELPGREENRTLGDGSVSSYFHLHPLRSMNGRKLDCLVWNQALAEPRRIPHRLNVTYPPDATISAGSGDFFVGLENAELTCSSRGNPEPKNFSWTWNGGYLPRGVTAVGRTLAFRRALNANDSGVYQCEVENGVGGARAEYQFNVKASSLKLPDHLVLILIGVSAGVLVLVLVLVVLLVHRHHRHKNKKLERQLSEKTEEIQSFSRQASFRRLNSVSTDPRVQGEDYALLRVDSRMKNSQTSLERPYKGSESTLGGRWGPSGGVELDELGRPVVWRQAEEEEEGEKEERRRRVESYLKSSNMSLDSGLPSSLVPPKAQTQPTDDGSAPPDLGPAPSLEDPTEGPYLLSEALTNHFYYSNGVLRPRPHSNAILLPPRGQII